MAKKVKNISKVVKKSIKSNSAVGMGGHLDNFIKALDDTGQTGHGIASSTKKDIRNMKKALSDGNMSDADKAVVQKNMKNAQAKLDVVNKNRGGSRRDMYNALSDHKSAMTGRELNIADKIGIGGEMAKDYFWTGANKTQRMARIGAAGVGYMAAANGVRQVTGGSATYNAKGERDIAGIPFI